LAPGPPPTIPSLKHKVPGLPTRLALPRTWPICTSLVNGPALLCTGRVRFRTTGRADGTCPNIPNDCSRYIIHTAHAAMCRNRHTSHQTAFLTQQASSGPARPGEETGSVGRRGRRRHAHEAGRADHGDHPDVTAAVNPPTAVITRPPLVGASRSSPPPDGVSPTGL